DLSLLPRSVTDHTVYAPCLQARRLRRSVRGACRDAAAGEAQYESDPRSGPGGAAGRWIRGLRARAAQPEQRAALRVAGHDALRAADQLSRCPGLSADTPRLAVMAPCGDDFHRDLYAGPHHVRGHV